jgi:hypothetical protein
VHLSHIRRSERLLFLKYLAIKKDRSANGLEILSPEFKNKKILPGKDIA